MGSTTRPKPSLRKRVVARIPAKHKVWRGLAHITIGTMVVAGRGVRVVGRAAGRGGRKAVRRVGTDVGRTLYGSAGRPPSGKWLTRTDAYRCVCGVTTRHLAEFNQHLVLDHRGEKRSGARPTIVRRAGRVIVRPADWAPTGGRHRRPTRRVANSDRVNRMVERWRPHLIAIGEKGMTDSNDASRIARAFADFADTPLPPGMKRSQLHDLFCTYERACVTAADELERLRRRMVAPAKEGGLGLDPRLVTEFIKGQQEHLGGMATGATRFLMGFEDVYRMYIRAVAPPPAVDLSA